MERLFDLDEAMQSDPDIVAWWSERPTELAMLAEPCWQHMKTCGSDVLERLHDGHPAACIERYPFAYVDTFTAHVNVGFYYGAFLPDPDGLLIGSGKRMRHVKLKPGAPVAHAALERLILAAYRDLEARLRSGGGQ